MINLSSRLWFNLLIWCVFWYFLIISVGFLVRHVVFGKMHEAAFLNHIEYFQEQEYLFENSILIIQNDYLSDYSNFDYAYLSWNNFEYYDVDLWTWNIYIYNSKKVWSKIADEFLLESGIVYFSKSGDCVSVKKEKRYILSSISLLFNYSLDWEKICQWEKINKYWYYDRPN